MSGTGEGVEERVLVAAPTPRRGALAIVPIDENSSPLIPTSDTSPAKAALSSHRFGEGSYVGSWACGRPEGRGGSRSTKPGYSPRPPRPVYASAHFSVLARVDACTAGTYTSLLGSSFVGVWRRGWADGAGVYHWSDGRADVGRFVGEAERLPLLAAVGEGVRWNRDRSKVSLLKNGVETEEEIPRERAKEIAERLGIVPPIPHPRAPVAHGAARVSKRELETLSSLSKRARTAIDSRLSSSAAAEEEDEGGDATALPFEAVWDLLCPKP